jgi:hypothetical protein
VREASAALTAAETVSSISNIFPIVVNFIPGDTSPDSETDMETECLAEENKESACSLDSGRLIKDKVSLLYHLQI